MGEIPGLFTRSNQQQTHTDVWVPPAPMEAVQPARPTNWHPRPRCFLPGGELGRQDATWKTFTTIEMNMDEHWKNRTSGTSFFSLNLFSDLPKSRWYSITNNKSSWRDTRIPIQINTNVPSIYEALLVILTYLGCWQKSILFILNTSPSIWVLHSFSPTCFFLPSQKDMKDYLPTTTMAGGMTKNLQMSIPSSSHFSFQCIKPAKGWCCWTCHLESSKSRGCSPSVVMGKETASIKNVLCPPRAYLTPKKHGKYQCSLSVEGATMLKKTWFLVHSTSLIPYLFQVRNTTLPSIFHCLWVDHVIFHPLIFYRQGCILSIY